MCAICHCMRQQQDDLNDSFALLGVKRSTNLLSLIWMPKMKRKGKKLLPPLGYSGLNCIICHILTLPACLYISLTIIRFICFRATGRNHFYHLYKVCQPLSSYAKRRLPASDQKLQWSFLQISTPSSMQHPPHGYCSFYCS